jgi:RES domain-containing protein
MAVRDSNIFIITGTEFDTSLPEKIAEMFGVSSLQSSPEHHARHAVLTEKLAELTESLSRYSRLLGEHGSPGEYLPSDLGQLLTWKQNIDRHLLNRQLLMNLAVASALPRQVESGEWYRLVPAYFISHALEGWNGTSRFNPGRLLHQTERFKTLHLASDITTALFEFPPGRYSPVRIRVELQKVADLTDPDVLEETLGISISQLIGPWPQTAAGPTHEIGAALYRAGYEGFKVPSATRFGRTNLVVFPQNVQKDSSITIASFEAHIINMPGQLGA